MKSALSEALADKRYAPDRRLEQLYRIWSRGTRLGELGNVETSFHHKHGA
ncbi:hypothetical protein [Streptomyces sp. NBC_01314]|nr:hypothetical protein OG622_03105 [Streptomyces sp. NBC_01314]